MRKTLVGFLFVAALGCGSSDDAQKIVGNWWAGAAPDWAASVGSTGSTTTIEIAFLSNGQYSAYKEQITSDIAPGAADAGGMATANIEVEDGTYTVTGSTLTCVPAGSTCAKPDPLSNVSISFTGSDLELDTSSGVISLQKNPPDIVFGGFVKTYGCFDSSGHFTEGPVVSVSNY
jgi:hypothetical protein